MKLSNTSLVGVLALVLLSACSSGSSKSTATPGTTSAVTKASYIAQANTLCRTMNERVAALGDPGKNPVDIAANIEQVQTIVADALDQLRRLAVPPGEEAKIAAVYAAVDTVQRDSTAYSDALRAGNQPGAAAALKRLAADQERANAAAIKYGLTVCGS